MRLSSAAMAALLTTAAHAPAHAAFPPEQAATPLVAAAVDDATLVPLTGTVSPLARAATDAGALDTATPLAHMHLWLNRPPARQAALDRLTADQVDPRSPYFRQWLAPADLGRLYGPAPADIQAAATWLAQHGFTVHGATPTGTVIDFSGTAGQVADAFHATLHAVRTGREEHIANLAEPAIPAALKDIIEGIRLNNFAPHALVQKRGLVSRTVGQAARAVRGPTGDVTIGNGSGGNDYIVAPADFVTIYGAPVSSLVSQAGIAVIEDSDMQVRDFDTFQHATIPYNYSRVKIEHPGNCNDPGLNGDETEAALDAEWAASVISSDTITVVACAAVGTNDGVGLAFENLVEHGTEAFIVSISYASCEQNLGLVFLQRWLHLTQEAAAEGLSVMVASGDAGPAGCENLGLDVITNSPATTGLAVNGLAASPYVTAVGGTDFDDTARNEIPKYWSTLDSGNLLQATALSYIPEIPWNDACAGKIITKFDKLPKSPTGVCGDNVFGGSNFVPLAAGSGTSLYFARPAWQTAKGLPDTPFRVIPDISLFAGNGLWTHFLIFCDTSEFGSNGLPCTSSQTGVSGYSGGGGTSFAAPAFASVLAGHFFNGHGNTKLGNISPTLYRFARAQFSSPLVETECGSQRGAKSNPLCIFRSVQTGDNAVACAAGTPDCLAPNGAFGVEANGKAPAYPAGLYYNQATGLGSVNIGNFWNNLF